MATSSHRKLTKVLLIFVIICIFAPMKPARIFYQYIWIINILRQYKRLTLEEINEMWEKDEIADGNPLNRKTFRRHKDAILDMFGIVIECDRDHGYEYYIENPSVLGDDTIEGWLLSTLTVNAVLADSLSLREYILLENVPAGEEYLQTIILAIKTRRRVKIFYQRFGFEGNEKIVSPYTLKLFHQRWYLLSHTGNHFATYSLDRMQSIEITDEPFEMPEDFSPEAYFSEYYGVLTDETPMAHVLVRAYGKTPNYLRTLPLHHSQRELESTPDYTDFSFDIRPTADFLDALIAHESGIEVLEPADLRQEMINRLQKMLARYR